MAGGALVLFAGGMWLLLARRGKGTSSGKGKGTPKRAKKDTSCGIDAKEVTRKKKASRRAAESESEDESSEEEPPSPKKKKAAKKPALPAPSDDSDVDVDTLVELTDKKQAAKDAGKKLKASEPSKAKGTSAPAKLRGGKKTSKKETKPLLDL